jgi:DNA polymerase-3 subunit alpha (Gram-positive type)
MSINQLASFVKMLPSIRLFLPELIRGGLGSMNNSAKKRDRFEMVLHQAEIPAKLIEAFFIDGYLERVECRKKNKEWVFLIHKKSLIPQNVYLQFYQQISERFKSIASIRIIIDYEEEVGFQAILDEYWSLLIQWLQREVVSVNGWLAKANLEVDDNTFYIGLLDEHLMQLAVKKGIDQYIHQYFQQFFNRDIKVRFRLNDNRNEEYEKFEQKRMEADRIAVQEAMSSSTEKESSNSKDEPKVRLSFGYDIKDASVPLMQVVDEETKIVVKGSIFGFDGEKELKNGMKLYSFYISDSTDSIAVKCFARSKEEQKALQGIANGMFVRIRGRAEFDRFMNPPELAIMATDINEMLAPPDRMDEEEEKRVEFHLHTSMSVMDAVGSVEDYIKRAAKWGHKAIAITDHSTVQAFPDANKAAKKHGIQVLYGVEANVVQDAVPIVLNPRDLDLRSTSYIVFDVETTGLSVVNNQLIEIAGVKIDNGKEVDRFARLINPHVPIPYHITQLTHIDDSMVKDAPTIEEVLPEFITFIGDAVLVAHNARFDMGFLYAACRKQGIMEPTNPVLDTLELGRILFPTMKNHRLNTFADKYKVSLDNHHRAVDDAVALGGILMGMIKDASDRGIINLTHLNDLVGQTRIHNARPFHCNIYATNATGKKNLFRLVSLSHIDYLNKQPCIPKSKLAELREGLLIISGCEKGEFFESVLNKSHEEAEQIANFYDVLEIQPIDSYMHLVDKGLVGSIEDLQKAVRTIIEIADKQGKPVIATGNVHYVEPEHHILRDITIHGITGFSPLKDIRKPIAHFRTTREMLDEFTFLGEAEAYRVVVTNTVKLAELFEPFEMFPKKGGPTDNGLFSPIIDGADEEIRTKCYKTAEKLYGHPLPVIVTERLERELIPIIKFGFSANYLISERLVKKSNADGYLVGSRGSVGSSFVATMLGITEVNPLPAHYLCPSCQYSDWFTDGSIPSGFDLKNSDCPKCGQPMKGEGQDIPFETFLGFKGDKVPDIDLNFSGEYQAVAHNYTKEIFGEKNVFRAGTIGTVAEKTAFGYVKKYEEDHGKRWRTAEVLRLAQGCTGVKRSTGQHPGGIVVVPDYIEVEDITPVQYPADDKNSEWKTTHFDYHAFDENLLKLDILGHDDPTMMHILQDLTGVDPTSIPMNDPKVMSVFNSTDALQVTPEQIRTPVATYGVPEMGTRFVRQMLQETNPSSFADLLQISGLSHGTGVWLGNAQELIKNQTCNIKTVIGCRDDIMLFLIYKAGMDAGLAFTITESVRKGKGLKEEWIDEMKKHKVPRWYIDSCLKIEYMFPKAHAAAYVISAVRTAYFKVYHPLAYYAAYFTVRADEFDIELFCQGYESILRRLVEIEGKGFQATPKEKGMISILEMGLEMTARGFGFKGIDLYRSEADKFILEGDMLIPPFSAIQGVGENAAKNLAAARADGDFLSIEDFQMRTKATKTVVELLNGLGCFRGLPESNQLSLF